MEILINNNIYNIPFDPLVITLGEYIDYLNLYGKELTKKFENAIKIEDLESRTIVLDNLLDEEAISWFSYWSKVDLLHAKSISGVRELLNLYRGLRYLISINEENCDFSKEITWNGEIWEIQDFKINPASEMSFNEIVTSKEIQSQMHQLGANKFETLLYLSAIFFRKKGEAFKDEFVYENSERLNLMRELPLAYAMNVSLFLIVCANTYNQHLESLEKEAA